jgi:cbb3-type cytochrome oxidase cytochrome c subunit
MKTGERNLLLGMAIVVIALMVFNGLRRAGVSDHRELPFYTTADNALQQNGGMLYKRLNCKSCHSLWSVRDIMRTVPAPTLDGMGSLRQRDWLYEYFSAVNPQSIIPSRLKKEYQMPSYAHLPEVDRQLLADYISSLKVKDWYLEQTRAAECRKLTGEDC